MQSFIQTIPGSTGSVNMVKVEGGVFDMGGESWTEYSMPVHRVALSDYLMAAHPVTQELWEAVMGKEKNESLFRGKRRPVETVSWEQINNDFLPVFNELTVRSRPYGTMYQLPTEAQGEYAARGGQRSAGYIYSGGHKLDDAGWYDENSHRETKPVGLKLPNELGLYDMSGNVWEWCSDRYGSFYYEICKEKGVVKDPDGTLGGDTRVLRGGCWLTSHQRCCVANRDGYHPVSRYCDTGFRLVLVYLPVWEVNPVAIFSPRPAP